MKYVVCTTPRSGSNYFGSFLRSLKLGMTKEIFNPDFIQSQIKKNKIEIKDHILNSKEYMNNLSRMKGFKLLWFQCEQILQNKYILEKIIELKPIFLLRENVIKQAISLYIAEKTDIWTSNSKKNTDCETIVEYEYDSILEFVDRINTHNSNWRIFLNIYFDEYLEIHYEDLLSNDRNKIIKQLSDYFGYDLALTSNGEPKRFKKQGGELNRELYDRFVADYRKEIEDKQKVSVLISEDISIA